MKTKDDFYDRAYRLRYNVTQLNTDRFSVFGCLTNIIIVFVRQSSFTLGLAEGVVFGVIFGQVYNATIYEKPRPTPFQ